MYRSLRVAVVIPAFNEVRAIGNTIRTVPSFVDHVLVIDDASTDGTEREAREASALRDTPDQVEIVKHTTNHGVGGAIASGYRRALELGVHVAVVMAGDGQMDPADLPALLDPIARGDADYVKGN